MRYRGIEALINSGSSTLLSKKRFSGSVSTCLKTIAHAAFLRLPARLCLRFCVTELGLAGQCDFARHLVVA